MAIVEHNTHAQYPGFVWAKSIQVTVGEEDAEISGALILTQEELDANPDPIRAYRQAIRRYSGAKRQGKNSPHVQFANADERQKQIAFVKRYGPIAVSAASLEERPIVPEDALDFRTNETWIVARQNLAEMERERLVYRSSLALLFELRREKESDPTIIRDCISTIVTNVSGWPDQWKRERQLRTSGIGYAHEPCWMFGRENLEHLEYWEWRATREPSDDLLTDVLIGSDLVYNGHLIICELINAFPPLVYPWGDSPVEAPQLDIAPGIRPLLYFMLRREYLGGGGTGICRHSDCRHVFEIERSGQEFCGDECSRLQRQREYWSIRGKRLRKRRLAGRRKKGSGPR
jgi:hypothetical protein